MNGAILAAAPAVSPETPHQRLMFAAIAVGAVLFAAFLVRWKIGGGWKMVVHIIIPLVLFQAEIQFARLVPAFPMHCMFRDPSRSLSYVMANPNAPSACYSHGLHPNLGGQILLWSMVVVCFWEIWAVGFSDGPSGDRVRG